MSSLPTDDRLLHVPGIQPRCRMLLMGLGGAGANAVSRMSETWREGPNVVAVNTDTKALAGCTASKCIAMGAKTTQGAGCAGDVTMGRLAAEESLEELTALLASIDILFLVVGLGGGTGTGAAPVLCEAARKLGVLTIVFATMPFHFEGTRRRRQADDGLRTLQQAADAVVCMPNQRLLDLVNPETTGLEEAFRFSDQLVGEGVHGLWRLITHRGVVNLDLADVRQVAERSGGSCAFAHVEASGPARMSMVLKNLIDSPLLEKGRLLSEAASVLVNITGGPDLTLADVQGIMGQIGAKVRAGAHQFLGAVIEPEYRDRIALTVLVSENWLDARILGDPAKPVAAKRSSETSEKPTEQGVLPLETDDKGRFAGVDPTYIGGQDLDIPTFIRRGARLSTQD